MHIRIRIHGYYIHPICNFSSKYLPKISGNIKRLLNKRNNLGHKL